MSKAEIGDGVPTIQQFPSYWYSTGPGVLLEKFVQFNTDSASSTKTSKSFTILVKRENTVFNLWHTLMEIFSATLTLDVLRSTTNPSTGRSFITPEDKVDIVILDDHVDGPFWDLWELATTSGSVQRVHAMRESKEATNVVLPLAGGSNSLWQGDWDVHDCLLSPTLRVFRQRVLERLNVSYADLVADRPLTLTFIDRQKTRRLSSSTDLLEALQAEFPAAIIQSVDFAELSIRDQVQMASRTDILIGVHGAGLTHAMFMPQGSCIVEILPKGVMHKGFRNLGKLLGHLYFSAHSSSSAAVDSQGWHIADVELKEERLLELAGAAIRSMYHRGVLSIDTA